MKKECDTKKNKILIVLILLIPFILLTNNDWLSKVLVLIYAAIFIYIIVDRDVLGFRLPPICEDHPDNKKKTEQSQNPIRNAEQKVHDDLKNKQIFNPFLFGEEPKKGIAKELGIKQVLKKPVKRRKK